MRLTVVGCSAAWGIGTDAASSCYLLEEGADAIALDFGQGAFARLGTLFPPRSLGAVVISHAHADHFVDLVPLRHHLRYEAVAAPGALSLFAPAGLPARLDALTGEQGFLEDLRFTPLAAGGFRIGAFDLIVAPVTHIADSFAFRVSTVGSRAGLVYSGDCGEAEDLLALVRPGDTLLCEASFGAEPVPAGVAHLNARAAAGTARAGAAGRLVLTHLQPGYDAAAASAAAGVIFSGETLLARPGLLLAL